MRSSNGSGSTAKRSRALATPPRRQPVATSTAPTSSSPGRLAKRVPRLGLEHGHVADHHPLGRVGDHHLAGRLLGDPGQRLPLLLGGAHEGVDAGVDLEPAQQQARAAVAQHQRPLGEPRAGRPAAPTRQPGRAPGS